MRRIIIMAVVAAATTLAAYGEDEKTATALPGEGYAPQFTWTKTDLNHYWLLDRGQKVALFGPGGMKDHNYSIALIRHFPGQEVDAESLIEPAIVNFVSRRGLGLYTYWISNKAMQDVVPVLKFDDSDPQRLRIHIAWKKNAVEKGTQDIVLCYDAKLRRYAVSVAFDLTVNERGGGEFCNVYPHGTGDMRPAVNKYDRLVWTDAGGKLKSHWLSLALPQPGKIALPKNATLAYYDEKAVSPCVILEECAPSARVDVCLCWFDSHLIWNEPVDPKDKKHLTELSGPPYRYTAKLKAYWLDTAESRALMARSQTVPLEPFADLWKNLLPFEMGGTNDLEFRTDVRNPPVKDSYLVLSPWSGVSWEEGPARSGRHALKLELKNAGDIESKSTGPELMITPGKRVKISAWVRTEKVVGEGFWLETGFARFDPDTGVNGKFSPDIITSRKVTGDNDWTKIEIPMPVTPPTAEFLSKRITLRFRGQGTVWLDDLEFGEETRD